MFRLYMLLLSLIAPALAGSGVIAALTTGMDTLTPILSGAGIGFVLSLPATWFVARQLV